MNNRYCKDCTTTLEHYVVAEVQPQPGRWVDGPNDRKHFRARTIPSLKYPSGWDPLYLCGRHVTEEPERTTV
jgi:hypothetical protein